MLSKINYLLIILLSISLVCARPTRDEEEEYTSSAIDISIPQITTASGIVVRDIDYTKEDTIEIEARLFIDTEETVAVSTTTCTDQVARDIEYLKEATVAVLPIEIDYS